ncbi:MAG: hypothetical protein AAF922_10330 [Pseudomonadota bacterium]
MRGIAKTALVLCVSFLMALRVVAHPLVMQAPAPGLVALCTNGQIVYFSLETGQPVEGETGPEQIKCPYAGLTALNVLGASDLSFDLIASTASDRSLTQDQLRVARQPLIHAARAPPSLS